MFSVTESPTYVDKTFGKVIQLREAPYLTTRDILDPWLDHEMLPEGVNAVLLNTYSHAPAQYEQGDYRDWMRTAKEPGTCIQQLFLYDHSGLSISLAPICEWDSSPVGVIGVKADTTERAEEYLNQIVKAWDDFLQFGSIDAFFYGSIAELLEGADYEDIVTVTSSLTPEEQVQEAAECAAPAKGHEWVPLKDAGSAVLKAIQDVVTAKNVDGMSDDEVQKALRTIKGWASII